MKKFGLATITALFAYYAIDRATDGTLNCGSLDVAESVLPAAVLPEDSVNGLRLLYSCDADRS